MCNICNLLRVTQEGTTTVVDYEPWLVAPFSVAAVGYLSWVVWGFFARPPQPATSPIDEEVRSRPRVDRRFPQQQARPRKTKNPKSFLAFFLLIILVYYMPGMLLSKAVFDPQGITVRDAREWRNERATINYTALTEVVIQREPKDPRYPRNIPRTFLNCSFKDGTREQVEDFGYLTPETLRLLREAAALYEFRCYDQRPAEPSS